MSNDWFNQPFFTENSGRQMNEEMFGGINTIFDHFNKMTQHMDKMMRSAFKDTFFDDDFGMPHASLGYSQEPNTRKPKVEEIDDSQNYSTSKKPRIEFPDDSDSFSRSNRNSTYNNDGYSPSKSTGKSGDNQKPYFYSYSSAQQAIYRPDGTVNMKRMDQDSTGKKHLAEMRRMGDKSVIYDRRIDSDGKPVDSVKPVGMTESELDDFNQKYQKKLHEPINFGLSYDRKSQAPKNALGGPSSTTKSSKPTTSNYLDGIPSYSKKSSTTTTPTETEHHHHHHSHKY